MLGRLQARLLSSLEKTNWQHALSHAVTDLDELVARLHLQDCLTPEAKAAMAQFPLRVPEPYLARIKPGDRHDPLLAQVLPLGIECVVAPGYTCEPLDERQYNPVPGLLHKYRSRVLLTITSACAINCRYCFRRHFDYASNSPSSKGWQAALDYIAKDPAIDEVILSGGDPLVAPDKRLAELIQQLAAISHLKYVRIHTRLPVVIPARVTEGLIAALTQTRLKPIVVLHCNHPQEIDAEVGAAMSILRANHIQLFNQTVLLANINDDSHVLTQLSHDLFGLGVIPYYLHMLDKVAGAQHFDISETQAKTLYKSLLTALPGYLVPKLVREEPGNAYKTPVL